MTATSIATFIHLTPFTEKSSPSYHINCSTLSNFPIHFPSHAAGLGSARPFTYIAMSEGKGYARFRKGRKGQPWGIKYARKFYLEGG